jgi:hypothetical protein
MQAVETARTTTWSTPRHQTAVRPAAAREVFDTDRRRRLAQRRAGHHLPRPAQPRQRRARRAKSRAPIPAASSRCCPTRAATSAPSTCRDAQKGENGRLRWTGTAARRTV